MRPSQVLTFDSTHAVLAAEKALRAAGMEYQIIPMPRQMSSDCGMAIRVPRVDGRACRDLLRSRAIRVDLHDE